MKRILLLLGLLISTGMYCMAQNYTEVVYLKNGSVIRGVIIEQIPNSSLKIQTADGSIFAYPIQEVERITKETAQRQNKYTKYGKPSLRGYKGFIESGFIFDLSDCNANHLNFSTIHGYQFNNYLFLGGGVGINNYTDADSYSVPIFANFRVNFMDKRITPFADITSGYSAGDVEGGFANMGLGVRFSLARKMAINVKLEYNYQEYDYSYHSYYYYIESESINGLGVKVGFEF